MHSLNRERRLRVSVDACKDKSTESAVASTIQQGRAGEMVLLGSEESKAGGRM